MTVISPNGKVQEAAKFITEKRKDNPNKSIASLIDEAGMRYNLTPIDSEALQRIFSKEEN